MLLATTPPSIHTAGWQRRVSAEITPPQIAESPQDGHCCGQPLDQLWPQTFTLGLSLSFSWPSTRVRKHTRRSIPVLSQTSHKLQSIEMAPVPLFEAFFNFLWEAFWTGNSLWKTCLVAGKVQVFLETILRRLYITLFNSKIQESQRLWDPMTVWRLASWPASASCLLNQHHKDELKIPPSHLTQVTAFFLLHEYFKS